MELNRSAIQEDVRNWRKAGVSKDDAAKLFAGNVLSELSPEDRVIAVADANGVWPDMVIAALTRFARYVI